jgi:hypothetical protein
LLNVKDFFTLQDIDCMPLHPLENFPESLRRQNIVNKYYRSFPEVKFEDRSREYGGSGAARFVPNVSFAGADATSFVLFSHSTSILMKQAKMTGDSICSGSFIIYVLDVE